MLEHTVGSPASAERRCTRHGEPLQHPKSAFILIPLSNPLRCYNALLDLAHRGDIVLDPFLGSGSTLVAADAVGRVCRGVELDRSKSM
jgi:DNA methylase